jgi:peptidoglycan/xylan/chitin deacetylase (PgdA/CDA1 family)
MRGRRFITRYGLRTLRRLFAVTTNHAMDTLTHVETQEPVAALTFDDGPHPHYTPRLLQILAKHRVRATFFMVGEAACRYPGVVQQVAAGGHVIGNHSWDHPSFPLLSGHERRQQIRACARAIAPYGQRLFRPPYLHQSVASRFDALRLGYLVIAGNVFSQDWRPLDADSLADGITARIQPGSIVMLHDAICGSVQAQSQDDREPMLAALDMVLGRLGRRFRFISIPELLRCGRPQWQHWTQWPEASIVPRLQAHPAVRRG